MLFVCGYWAEIARMISVLCLSFANKNEIQMCHDLLLNVHGYLNDVRAKSRRLCAKWPYPD